MKKTRIVCILFICMIFIMGCQEEEIEEKAVMEKHGIMEDGDLNLEPLVKYYGDNLDTVPSFERLRYLVYTIYYDGEGMNYVLDMENDMFYHGFMWMDFINRSAENKISLKEEHKEQVYDLLKKYQVDTWDSLYSYSKSYDYSWVLALEFEDGTIARYAGDNDWDDKSPEGYSEFEQAWADLAEEWIKEYHLENPDQSIISSLEGFESGMKQVSENAVSNEVPTEE